MNLLCRIGILVLFVATGLQTAAAVDPFKATVDLVALDVCVNDHRGRFPGGLTADDFLVLDNKVPQQILFISESGQTPSAITLLIDNSRSMAGEPLNRARAAAAEFVGHLRPNDLVGIITFNEHAHIRYPLGSDHAAAKASLDSIVATGTTRLYDATLVALREVERARRTRADHRSVLIVLSDGDDTSSRLPFDGVLDEVRRSGVMVYTISLRIGRRARPPAAPWPMTALATESGGRAVTVQNLSDLADTYHDIHGELANLYRIGYVPVPAPRDGGWRKISVRVPGTSFVARTRQGYYAPRPASGHKDKKPEERPR